MEVVDYDPELPAIKFSDGSWEAVDRVVAYDSVKSKAARIVSGGEKPPKATGTSAFRMMIPDEKMAGVSERFKENNLIREKFNKDNSAVCEEWTARCDKQVLLDEFGHWHPLFQEIFKAADDDPLLWKGCSRAPRDTLHKGKLCMLGDALHPMPPFRAQGGSQSIEDAGALEMIATNLVDRSELPKRLEMLDRLRVPRYSCAQMISSVRQDELNMEERYIEVLNQCRKWFEGEDQSHRKAVSLISKEIIGPRTDTVRHRAAFQQWLHSYDVGDAAGRAVSKET
ncbi:uncharacterized protein Z519_08756 [Cladophialophora bantiana CBS 173.52]|uniref:FAD-binding domain-containing protein n=1 Tax=Cladophialophora bantiana (strain ATCC 10958 / CBS 173.52 / CDC B-1940 / NIH 8579) TaxID=1442370 RepID=A0A0D2HCJ5_CLAB1|nr:uncharacterized protein Z519_08756 [Cladophialophora bantiana CBS 173.52]KIW90973.1 hypothetical protein Z519_08756 [Cladophialophora bantiana CBS 173.52]